MIKKTVISTFILLGLVCRTVCFASADKKYAPEVLTDSIPVSVLDTLYKTVHPKYKATYMHLLKQIFYKIETNENGLTAIKTLPISNIFNQYQKTAFEDTFAISSLQKLMVNSSGKSLLLLICQVNFIAVNFSNSPIGEHLTIISLFDPVSGKLLDMVDVTSDKFTDLAKVNAGYILPLSSKQGAIAIWNIHHNSSQGYNNCSVLSVVNNKIKEVFSFFILNYSFSCEEFKAHAEFKFSKGGKKLFDDMFVTVRSNTLINGYEKCTGKKTIKIKNYKSHLIWDNHKKIYVDQLKDFEALEKHNKAGM